MSLSLLPTLYVLGLPDFINELVTQRLPQLSTRITGVIATITTFLTSTLAGIVIVSICSNLLTDLIKIGGKWIYDGIKNKFK